MSALAIALLENKKNDKQVTACLAQCGHETIVVDSFAKAKDLLLTQPCGLIISDVHLENGGSVFDFLRWVKGDPHMHATPFVCFSAEPPEVGKYLADGVRTAARSLGAARYISMETFDEKLFLHEIEWLIPEEKVGSYYSGNDGSAEKVKAEH